MTALAACEEQLWVAPHPSPPSYEDAMMNAPGLGMISFHITFDEMQIQKGILPTGIIKRTVLMCGLAMFSYSPRVSLGSANYCWRHRQLLTLLVVFTIARPKVHSVSL